jgi:hypothetical protein
MKNLYELNQSNIRIECNVAFARNEDKESEALRRKIERKLRQIIKSSTKRKYKVTSLVTSYRSTLKGGSPNILFNVIPGRLGTSKDLDLLHRHLTQFAKKLRDTMTVVIKPRVYFEASWSIE